MVGQQYAAARARSTSSATICSGNVEAGLKLNALDFAAAEQTRRADIPSLPRVVRAVRRSAHAGGAGEALSDRDEFPRPRSTAASFENYIDWIAPAYLITLVSLPAATAPAGLSHDGLPVGMQIVAPRFEEPLILRVARQSTRPAASAGRRSAPPDLAMPARSAGALDQGPARHLRRRRRARHRRAGTAASSNWCAAGRNPATPDVKTSTPANTWCCRD